MAVILLLLQSFVPSRRSCVASICVKPGLLRSVLVVVGQRKVKHLRPSFLAWRRNIGLSNPSQAFVTQTRVTIRSRSWAPGSVTKLGSSRQTSVTWWRRTPPSLIFLGHLVGPRSSLVRACFPSQNANRLLMACSRVKLLVQMAFQWSSFPLFGTCSGRTWFAFSITHLTVGSFPLPKDGD